MATAQVLDLEFNVPSGSQVKEPFDAIVAGESRARQAQAKTAGATINNLNRLGTASLLTAKKVDVLTRSAGLFGRMVGGSAIQNKLLGDSYEKSARSMKKLTDAQDMAKAGFIYNALLARKLRNELDDLMESIYYKLPWTEKPIITRKEHEKFKKQQLEIKLFLQENVDIYEQFRGAVTKADTAMVKMGKTNEMMQAGLSVTKFLFHNLKEAVFEYGYELIHGKEALEAYLKRMQLADEGAVKMGTIMHSLQENSKATRKENEKLAQSYESLGAKLVKLADNAPIFTAGGGFLDILGGTDIEETEDYLDSLKEAASATLQSNKSNQEKLKSMEDLTVKMSEATRDLMEAGVAKDNEIFNKIDEIWKNAAEMWNHYDRVLGEDSQWRKGFDEQTNQLQEGIGYLPIPQRKDRPTVDIPNLEEGQDDILFREIWEEAEEPLARITEMTDRYYASLSPIPPLLNLFSDKMEIAGGKVVEMSNEMKPLEAGFGGLAGLVVKLFKELDARFTGFVEKSLIFRKFAEPVENFILKVEKLWDSIKLGALKINNILKGVLYTFGLLAGSILYASLEMLKYNQQLEDNNEQLDLNKLLIAELVKQNKQLNEARASGYRTSIGLLQKQQAGFGHLLGIFSETGPKLFAMNEGIKQATGNAEQMNAVMRDSSFVGRVLSETWEAINDEQTVFMGIARLVGRRIASVGDMIRDTVRWIGDWLGISEQKLEMDRDLLEANTALVSAGRLAQKQLADYVVTTEEDTAAKEDNIGAWEGVNAMVEILGLKFPQLKETMEATDDVQRESVDTMLDYTKQTKIAETETDSWLDTVHDMAKEMAGANRETEIGKFKVQEYGKATTTTKVQIEHLNRALGDYWTNLERIGAVPVTIQIGQWAVESASAVRDASSYFQDIAERAELFTYHFNESTHNISKMLARIARESDHTAQATVGNLDRMSFMLKTLKLDIKETEEFLTQYQKMLAVYSEGGADTARVSDLLSKAFVSNKLAADDLSIVFTEAPELFIKMADAAAFTGHRLEEFTLYNYKTLESLKKLAAEGKLTEDFFLELIKQISKGSDDIDAAFAKTETSAAVQADRLKVAWGEFAEELSRMPLFLGKIVRYTSLVTGGMTATADAGTELTEKTSSFVETLTEGLSKMNRAFDAGGTAFKQFIKDITGGWKVDSFDYFFNLLGVYPKKLDKVIKKFDYLKEAMAQAAQFSRKWGKALKEEMAITDKWLKKEDDRFEKLRKNIEKLNKDFDDLLKKREVEVDTIKKKEEVYKKLGVTQKQVDELAKDHAQDQMEAAINLLVAADIQEKAFKKMVTSAREKALESHEQSVIILQDLGKLQKEYHELILQDLDEQGEARKFILEKDIANQKAYFETVADTTDKLIAQAEKYEDKWGETDETMNQRLAKARSNAMEILDKHTGKVKEAAFAQQAQASAVDGADEALKRKAETLDLINEKEARLAEAYKDLSDQLDDVEDSAESKSKTIVDGAKAEEEAIDGTNKALDDQAQLLNGLKQATEDYGGTIVETLEEGGTVIVSTMEAIRLQGLFLGDLQQKTIEGHKVELKLKSKVKKSIDDQNKALRTQGKLLDKNIKKSKTLARSNTRSDLLGRFIPSGEGDRSYGFGVRAGISPHQEDVMHDVATKIAQGMAWRDFYKELGLDSNIGRRLRDETWRKKVLDIISNEGMPTGLSGLAPLYPYPRYNDIIQLDRIALLAGDSTLSELANRDWTKITNSNALNITNAQKQAVRESLRDGVLSPAEEAGIRNSVRSLAVSAIDSRAHPLFQDMFKSKLDTPDGIVDALFEEAIGISDVRRHRVQYGYDAGIKLGGHLKKISDQEALEIVSEAMQRHYGQGSALSEPLWKQRLDVIGKKTRSLLRADLADYEAEEGIYDTSYTPSSSVSDINTSSREVDQDLERRNALLQQQINLRESFARSIAREVGPIGSIPMMPTGETTFADAPMVTGGGGSQPQTPYVPPPQAPPPVEVDVGVNVDQVTQAGLSSTDVDTENMFMNAQNNSGRPTVQDYINWNNRGLHSMGGARRSGGGSGRRKRTGHIPIDYNTQQAG